MRIIETKAFMFEELNSEARKKAIESFQHINVEDDFWHDNVIDDAKQIGALMGIDIDKVYFSGFWSQGDGACFTGTYAYKKGSVKAVKEYAPRDEAVHSIAERLSAIQKDNFYKLGATIKHSGHYYHEYCTDIDVRKDDNYPSDAVIIEVADCLRDYMRWIYRQLEKEYYYQTSDEAIIDTIEANEYEFTEEGKQI
jgi:hypothetical protein